MKKALVILTRLPTSPMTGRKVVLRCALEMLVEHGFELDVLSFAEREDRSDGEPHEILPLPRLSQLFASGVATLWNGKSLNEAAYWSSRANAIIQSRMKSIHYDLIYCDMLRTAQYFRDMRGPILVDLDDLLSQRYLQAAAPGSDAGADILGYYGQRLPRSVASALSIVSRPMLRWESRRIKQREVRIARHASAVSLVSAKEAAALSRESGRPITALPMYVHVPAEAWEASGVTHASGVFLGASTYRPNWLALSQYAGWRAANSMVPVLTVIGDCPADHRARFGEHVVFRGYVEDLHAEMRQYPFFVAPVTSGSGIKTKVLEAMALGIPVLATVKAVEGLAVIGGQHFLEISSAETLLESQQRLKDPNYAKQIGAAGRRFVEENYSRDVLTSRWAQCLQSVSRL